MKISLISVSTYPGDQGLRTVSSSLKKESYEVEMIFLPLEEDYSKFYTSKVLEQLRYLCANSDLIGVSSYASTSRRAVQVIRALKILNKPIVYGGVHVTIFPELGIRDCDIVCIGEGEEAIVELAKKLENKKDITKIKNLWIRHKDKIYKNPIRRLVENIDKIPAPDYDINNHYILEKNRIVRFKERHINGQIFFLTGRGCPNACTYCFNSNIHNLYKGKGRFVRWHTPEYIIKNMEILKNRFKSLNFFDVRDDTFCIRTTKQIREFCKKYKERIKLRFKCLADPKTTNEEKIRLLVDAGCTDIIVGIQGQENINFNVYRRYQTDEQVVRAAQILNKYKGKLMVMYDVITSNPYEEAKDVLNLIRLLQKLPKPYFLSVNNLVFFPGSELYKRAVKEDVIKKRKDTAAHLNYWDRFKHIRLKRKNAYPNLILNLMRGVVTNKRYGIMPSFLLNILLKKKMVRFNLRNPFLTYFIGSFVEVSDLVREKILKPIYRSLPVGFKVWYDKIRYRI